MNQYPLQALMSLTKPSEQFRIPRFGSFKSHDVNRREKGKRGEWEKVIFDLGDLEVNTKVNTVPSTLYTVENALTPHSIGKCRRVPTCCRFANKTGYVATYVPNLANFSNIKHLSAKGVL
jgi:hypothetical protein